MITSYLARVADIFLLPLLNIHPLISLLILSFTFSFILLLYQRMLFNKNGIREVKIRMEKMMEKLMRVKDSDQEELNKIWREVLKLNARLMKENLKIMFLSIFIGGILLSWVSFHYSGYYIKVPLPIFSKISLIQFYLILCIVIGIVMSKFSGVK